MPFQPMKMLLFWPMMMLLMALRGHSLAPAASFERFSTNASTYDALLLDYSKWHRHQMRTKSCETKLSIVMRAPSGVGDTAFSLRYAFTAAIRTGRLFFLDWSMPLSATNETISWREVIAKPPFAWDFNDAVRSRSICPSPQNGVIDNSLIVINNMHVLDNKWHLLRQETMLRKKAHSYGRVKIGHDAAEGRLLRFLLKPSAAINSSIMKLQSFLNKNFVVALAIRTGIIEDTSISFLNEGDENLFLECAESIRKQLDMTVARDIVKNPSAKLVFFVNSDSKQVINKVKQQADEAGWGDSVFTSSGDSITPSWRHLKGTSSNAHKDGIYKAFEDFFLLSSANVAVLTGNSLFGDSGTKRAFSLDGGGGMYRRYVISSSSCEDPLQSNNSEDSISTFRKCKRALEKDLVELHCSGKLTDVNRANDKQLWKPLSIKAAEL